MIGFPDNLDTPWTEQGFKLSILKRLKSRYRVIGRDATSASAWPFHLQVFFYPRITFMRKSFKSTKPIRPVPEYAMHAE